MVAPGSADFPRTRLTHSLECAQIGRELGREIGCDPDLVDAACLAHDIGHSPFGHNGEAALNALGGFEGNAQSLRLLTRLEPKVVGAGLNLTRATLDATLKYPWFPGDPAGKYGVYPEDAPVFGWIRVGAPPGRRCLEAQVMDWADDVAYSVHDLEDGFHAGLVKFTDLKSERTLLVRTAAAEYCDATVSEAELSAVLDSLLAMDAWPRVFDGTEGSLAALKQFTGQLHGRLCVPVQQATLAAAGPGPHTRYGADLVVPRQQRLECALLKGITAHYVMGREGAAAAQARERELLTELVHAVERGAPGTLDPLLHPAWHAAISDADHRRVVIDQVAALTDTSAQAWHHRLHPPH